MKRRLFLMTVLIVSASAAMFGQNETPLLRDEVASIKKKLVVALDALGQPPAGYSKEREDFNLPTEAYKQSGSGLFTAIHCSAQRTFGSKKKAERSANDMGKEYQKKMAEAQAKGDIQAITKLAQEMQQKVGQMQLNAVEGTKEPIEVHVQFNTNPGAMIDPDAVVFERTGVIALKHKDDGTEEKGTVTVYIDPVALRDTKQLSRAEMRLPAKGTSSRTAVFNSVIELRGPLEAIEAWAKTIDTGKILAQIDGKL
jgi:hypothetical protein